MKEFRHKVSANLDDDEDDEYDEDDDNGPFNSIGNSDQDDDYSSSGFDNISFDGVDVSGNTGHTTIFSNVGNRGPPVANGATTKYGYSNVMTHIPTVSQEYGRIVKLEKKASGINVILLRKGGKITTFHHKGTIRDVDVKNKQDGVYVKFTRNGKKWRFYYK
uniref:Uncharacterized protein n=1 Tax=Cacopsylla melanoneura TaxID=428564 RepID=A0A8D8UL93_9HEMI